MPPQDFDRNAPGRIDAWLAERTGVEKAEQDWLRLLALIYWLVYRHPRAT